MPRRDHNFATIKTQLDNVNAQIGAIEHATVALKQALRGSAAQALATPQGSAKQARHKLAEIKLASESTWYVRVSNLERLRNDLLDAFGTLKTRRRAGSRCDAI